MTTNLEHKTAHLAFALKRQQLPNWWQVARMNPGAARRQLMTQILLQHRTEGGPHQVVRVNDKYVLPSSDSDLRVLVRRGVLVRKRVNACGRKRNTELHLSPAFVANHGLVVATQKC